MHDTNSMGHLCRSSSFIQIIIGNVNEYVDKHGKQCEVGIVNNNSRRKLY